MGLLSSTAGREKAIKLLLKHYIKISVFSYVVGIAWMCLSAHHELSAVNYFSENQLLPGLVETHFSHAHYAGKVYADIKVCCFDNSMVNRKLVHYMEEEGLDVDMQKYSIQSMGISGENVIGIYRSPRASGVESLVLNVPNHGNCSSTGGLALILAMVKYFRQQTFWAKDIVFLVTDNQEYGVKAWLHAYYNKNDVDLKAENIKWHGGSIQAALIVDMEKDFLTRFDLLITGLNAQMPNLDVVHVAFKIARDEWVPMKFYHQDEMNQRKEDFYGNLRTLFRMMLAQASGYPSGNHGMFIKHRIEAVTLRAVNGMQTSHMGFESPGRMIEGIFRSFNNMLEHFHQSFFFYVLPNYHRYISIGLYMPPVGCVLLPALLALLVMWMKLFQLDKSLSERTFEPKVGSVFLQLFKSSIGALFCHFAVRRIFDRCDVTTDEFLFIVNCAVPLGVALLTRVFWPNDVQAWRLLNLLATLLMVLATAVLSILNFSAAFFVAVYYVPFVMCLSYDGSRLRRSFNIIILLLSSPPVFLYSVCVLHTVLDNTLTNETSLLHHALGTWKNVILHDSKNHVLGAWTNTFYSFGLVPIWLLLTVLVT